MAIVGKKPKKARQGRPPTKTGNQRYKDKNRPYLREMDNLRYSFKTNKITKEEYLKEIKRIKKKYNKK